MTLDIQYDQRDRVKSVNGFAIAGDKHAYKCIKCGAIFQSKNIECRSTFVTDDPKCRECASNDSHNTDLVRVCKCEPVIQY